MLALSRSEKYLTVRLQILDMENIAFYFFIFILYMTWSSMGILNMARIIKCISMSILFLINKWIQLACYGFPFTWIVCGSFAYFALSWQKRWCCSPNSLQGLNMANIFSICGKSLSLSVIRKFFKVPLNLVCAR